MKSSKHEESNATHKDLEAPEPSKVHETKELQVSGDNNKKEKTTAIKEKSKKRTDDGDLSQTKPQKQRKPDPFAKEKQSFEAKQQAEQQRLQEQKEREKKLRADRAKRMAKKSKHTARTPRGQPIMKNVLANIMSKLEKT